MIISFRHKGLEDFFLRGSKKGIIPAHEKRLIMRLTALDTAREIGDIDLPGLRLHRLSGERQETWSIAVDGNWRLTFQMQESNIYILDYEDYH